MDVKTRHPHIGLFQYILGKKKKNGAAKIY